MMRIKNWSRWKAGQIMVNKREEELKRRISELESINDQLTAELRYLDTLLKEVGFEEGLVTLKQAALELLKNDSEDIEESY